MSLFGSLKLGGCLLGAALLLPAATRSQSLSCRVDAPTAESYRWNFQTEAQGLLDNVASVARNSRGHADQLQSMMWRHDISWESQALELNQIRDEVNELGQKLCRLETIRRVTSPWERKAIDQAAPLISELAKDTENAITLLKDNHNNLFMPAYTSLGTDLYRRSQELTKSVTEFDTFGKIHQQDMHLEKSLGLTKSS